MRRNVMAFLWLRLGAIVFSAASLGFLLLLADDERLSYFTYFLFKHQETLKSLSILGVFVGVFFLFYTGSKIPSRYVKLVLFKGSMKLHPDLIKQQLDQWLSDQKIHHIKLISVSLEPNQKIGLEIKTDDLNQGLLGIEEVEIKLKSFMSDQLGIKSTVDVHLFEV